jgi:hypothetical protein
MSPISSTLSYHLPTFDWSATQPPDILLHVPHFIDITPPRLFMLSTSPLYAVIQFNEANLNQIVDACLATTDPSILLQQIQGTYDVLYGLDFLVDDQRRTILHLLAEHLEFVHWDTLFNAFAYLDCTDSSLQTPLHVAVSNRNLVHCNVPRRL